MELIWVLLVVVGLAILLFGFLWWQNMRQAQQLRADLEVAARHTREEILTTLTALQQGTHQQTAEHARTQNTQLNEFSTQLAQHLTHLSLANDQRLAEIRQTLYAQLAELTQGNEAKLEQVRTLVGEKLQATLDQRLGENFSQVAQRLEQVHQGLGEMQHLAQGVGSLQRLLSNVKSRGLFGEVQLAALLEDVFTPQQYGSQVNVNPHTHERVDFAIRLPGRSADDVPVWLPIDAKFPKEDYERLLEAQEAADAPAEQAATKVLIARLRTQAKSIAQLYIVPPHTTDFAILFLPTESLYIQVLKTPGIIESLQKDYRVTLAGPATLLAMLNSLHLGFRTLAIEQQASEVWSVLERVKTEFERYEQWVTDARIQIHKVAETLEKAETRTQKMRQALKTVGLNSEESSHLP